MATDYLIAGGTGLVGSEIIRQLLANEGTRKIITLGRRAADFSDKRLTHLTYDFSGRPQKSALPSNCVAICTLGTTIKQAGSQEAFRKVDFDYVLNFAEIARDIKASSLHVVTAHGAAKSSLIFYNRVKGEIEEAIQRIGLVEVHIYRPSLLIGNRKEHRAGEGFAAAAAKALSPVFKLPGLSSVQPTPADHLAAFIIRQASSVSPGNHVHSNAEIMNDR